MQIGDSSPDPADFNWSSPLIANGYAYVGLASFCDNPLIQGQLLQINLQTHQIQQRFNVVPSGQVGGSIWTSPTLDRTSNTIYLATGNQDYNLSSTQQPYAVALVALDATTLAVKGYWQLPVSQQAPTDSDWTTTPILFSDARGNQLVAAISKSGYLYAFMRNAVSAGPVWQVQIARAGSTPELGDASVSSAAFANGTLLYRYGVPSAILGASTIANGRLFTSTFAGEVLAFGVQGAPIGGSITRAGGSSAYTFIPPLTGSATVATCAATPITNVYRLSAVVRCQRIATG